MPTVASETPDPSIAYRLHASELIATLRTDDRRGLSDDEARARLEQHGSNELAAEKPVPAWRRFLSQLGCACHPASHRDRHLRRPLVLRARGGLSVRGPPVAVGRTGGSVVLQVVVVYVPFLQNAFGTRSLNPRDWLFCVAVASSVLWLREGEQGGGAGDSRPAFV